mgnify:CR=1 FL=1
MTRNESHVLLYIRNHTQNQGIPPTYQEMAHSLNIKSRSNIHRIVTSLVNQGFITKKIGSVRACFLTASGNEYAQQIQK